MSEWRVEKKFRATVTKTSKHFVMTIFLLIFGIACRHSEPWKYLGQRPPGNTPEVFAPGIISGKTRLHCFPAISQNGKEIFWMTIPPRIYRVEYRDGNWGDPQIFPLFEKYACQRPFISYDGKRLYFSSVRVPGGYGSLDIWYIERTENRDPEPINIGPPINTDKLETQQTFTKRGTIYYCGYVAGKRFNRGILYSEYKNSAYSEPRILDVQINIIDTDAIDYTPFIAADESYLLFCSNRHNMSEEDCRIYISFKNGRGEWSSPINLNDKMGFDEDCRDPYVSPDGKYLFFSSGQNIYWMDSEIIDEVRRKRRFSDIE